MGRNNERIHQRVRRVLQEESVEHLAREGFWFGVERTVEQFHRLNGNWKAGTSVWDQEWDCYILLDACRLDLMHEVISEDIERDTPRWPRLHEVQSMWSLGSASDEWMNRNFGLNYEAEKRLTAHVTGNLFSRSILDDEGWALLDEVWRYGWNGGLGTTPASSITDRAIDAGRNSDAERLIVHYMQPHYPFVEASFSQRSKSLDSAIDKWGSYDKEQTIWHRLRDGKVSQEDVWAAYKHNLEYVLEEVSDLLDNLDADRVLITADHANALGEWGIWGHPPGVAIDVLREVPLIETTATDTKSRQVETTHQRTDLESDEVEARLTNLGYM